jgi:flagellar assembly factor FliW
MKVNTTRFGVIDTDDSSVITLVKGPLGFEPQNRYCLIQHRPDTKFRWLQSLDDGSLAFVVVDPSEFFTNYEFEVSDTDAEKISLDSAEDALALAIVTIGKGGEEVTANLAAPILINAKNLAGTQVVLQDNSYSVKHPLVEQPVRDSEARKGAGSKKKSVGKAA